MGGIRAASDFRNHEAATFWRFISSSLDRLISVLDGRSVAELNWRPAAPDTNSIYVLAIHTLENARENILGILCGKPPMRSHAEEFASVATATSVPIASWPELRRELLEAMAALEPDALEAVYLHPRRGETLGRDILIVVARHAAEHLGQAELTRDLAVAALAS
jgi:hypothetical protein